MWCGAVRFVRLRRLTAIFNPAEQPGKYFKHCCRSIYNMLLPMMVVLLLRSVAL